MNVEKIATADVFGYLKMNFPDKYKYYIENIPYLHASIRFEYENDNGNNIYLLEDDNEVIGMAHVKNDENKKYTCLLSIGILEQQRGKGLSELFLSDIISDIKEKSEYLKMSSIEFLGMERLVGNILKISEKNNLKVEFSEIDSNEYLEDRIKETIKTMDYMQEANDIGKKSFFFEEGGCWAMAIALKAEFAKRRIHVELGYDEKGNHSFIVYEGICYDYTGKMVQQPNYKIVSRRYLMEKIKENKCEEDFESDLISAMETIDLAKELYIKENEPFLLNFK